MTIQILQVPPIGTNCYMLKDEKTGLGAIIDPGGAADGIADAVKKMEMTPAVIFLTHGHYDHTGAVQELTRIFPDVKVYLHPLDGAKATGASYLMPSVGETVPYDEGDEVSVGGMKFQVYHTPGHTPGSVTLRCDEALFTGDTLFQGSCGRTDFPGGSMDDMMASLRRLSQLEGNLQVFPGHEGYSTLEEERRSNHYMLYAMKQ